ncbi:MAG: hypothetical protein O7G85_03700 [Planctomycetota bacterium]|nr:hypothetical protein [Planctomycetota bacterium]
MIDAHPAKFESMGWTVHTWAHAGQDVTVLQREPFRLKWFATQLVTFIFVIRRTPENYQSVLDDYSALRGFAKEHKKTPLPIAFQCGYALLPIYIGNSFSESLLSDIRSTFVKHWCVFHVPSLLDSGTGQLHALEKKFLWGGIYRSFITSTVAKTAKDLVTQGYMA